MMNRSTSRLAAVCALATTFTSAQAVADENWPIAAGPNHNWTVTSDRQPPTRWSVEREENVRWRVPMPETGQSGIAVWRDRLFLTTMEPLPADAKDKKRSGIVLLCVDADSGEVLWQKPLPGDPQAPSIYAYGFSNSSSPTPITDGEHVWFFNASGAMGCWTVDGDEVWTRRWTPTLGRPFNKQYEPIKVGDAILNVEPLDLDDPDRREDAWNYLHAFGATTGERLWTAREGLTHYNTPTLGRLADGGYAVLSGRGAYHGTPEGPPGLTLTRIGGDGAGQAIWNWESLPRGKAMSSVLWDERFVYWLDEAETDVVVLNTADGTVAKRINRVQNVDVTSYDHESQSFTRAEGVDLSAADPPVRVFPAWYANACVYPHVYFQCFDFQGVHQRKTQNVGPRTSIARVNVETEKVEYLQLPFDVPMVDDQYEKGKQTFYPRMTINNAGVDVASDKRSGRTGWWWCFNGNPIAVNHYVYFTFMGGQVQVLDDRAEVFDQRALVALNDLGAFGQTWSVNTPSYSRGRIYHRTMKELICIEADE